MTESREGAAEVPLNDPADKTQPAEGGRDEADEGAASAAPEGPPDEAGVTEG